MGESGAAAGESGAAVSDPAGSGRPAGDPGDAGAGAAALEGSAASRPQGPLRRLYHWTLGWADRPGGAAALTGIAFAESSFFPIPPDVLLIPLALGRPKRALWFAFLCTAGSVAGAVLGYWIGSALFQVVARPILELYGYMDLYREVGRMYDENLVWALGAAGFTPIPFKVFTIAGGGFGVSFPAFIAVSIVSRGARFFLVAGLIRIFGEQIRGFIERYFNLLTIVFVVLLVGGFLALPLLF